MPEAIKAAARNGFFTSEFWVAVLGPFVLELLNNWAGTVLTPDQIATGGWAMVAYVVGRVVLKVATLLGWKTS